VRSLGLLSKVPVDRTAMSNTPRSSPARQAVLPRAVALAAFPGILYGQGVLFGLSAI